MPRHVLLALALVSLVAVPAASSAWRVGGSYEPDTSYDSETWMWPDAPPVGEQRIYFNAITMSHETFAGANLNVGLLGTRNEAPADEYHVAILGVWVDCNGDGYIGAAEHALREYPASLLASEAACPALTGPHNAWTAGAHNYNGWVSEYVPIAREPIPTADRRVYRDDAAMVWGDYHRPDEKPYHRSCTLVPHPRGTFATTGGVMNLVECRFEQKGLDGLGTFNQAMGEIGDPLGLRFGDEDDARTGTLGRLTLGGAEDSARSPATVWDCSRRTNMGELLNTTPLGPVAPNFVRNLAVTEVRPALGDTSNPSAAAFVNHTYEGGPLDDCDHSNDDGRDVYDWPLESDFSGVDPNNKTEADWNFRYESGSRGVLATLLGARDPLFGSSGVPGADLGIGWTGFLYSGWFSDSTWSSKVGPSLVRANLTDAGFAPAYWLTFYGFVGENTTERGFARTPGSGVYGSWHCGSATSGVKNGWNCDASAWYTNPNGVPYVEEYPLARPGQTYLFRDVDCYDGSNDLGIPLGTAAYGPAPCA